MLFAAVAGMLFDSLLGALLERRNLLNNDAVNFLSTVFAAALAFLFSFIFSGLTKVHGRMVLAGPSFPRENEDRSPAKHLIDRGNSRRNADLYVCHRGRFRRRPMLFAQRHPDAQQRAGFHGVLDLTHTGGSLKWATSAQYPDQTARPPEPRPVDRRPNSSRAPDCALVVLDVRARSPTTRTIR